MVEIQAPGIEKPIVLAESAAIIEYLTDHFGIWLIPKRYPEGKDGMVGAETEEWLRYRVSAIYRTFATSCVRLIHLFLHRWRFLKGS